MKTLDMMGQPCPIPVVSARKALVEKGADGADGVVVLVDNFVAVQNLEKMAKGEGFGFSFVEEGASKWRVTIIGKEGGVAGGREVQNLAGQSFDPPPRRGGSGQAQLGSEGEASPPKLSAKGPVVLITADCMGRGAEDLGKLLIKGFIFSLTQLSPLPEAVLFLNGGARLTTEGANTVPDLKALEEKGVVIGTCGTCANYYKLTERLAVGGIVDMMKITNTLAGASVVITI